MAKEALTAHARDKLGISKITTARPVRAALTSAAAFSVGTAMPLLMVVMSPAAALLPIMSAGSLGFLALLGTIGAREQAGAQRSAGHGQSDVLGRVGNGSNGCSPETFRHGRPKIGTDLCTGGRQDTINHCRPTVFRPCDA